MQKTGAIVYRFQKPDTGVFAIYQYTNPDQAYPNSQRRAKRLLSGNKEILYFKNTLLLLQQSKQSNQQSPYYQIDTDKCSQKASLVHILDHSVFINQLTI